METNLNNWSSNNYLVYYLLLDNYFHDDKSKTLTGKPPCVIILNVKDQIFLGKKGRPTVVAVLNYAAIPTVV